MPASIEMGEKEEKREKHARWWKCEKNMSQWEKGGKNEKWKQRISKSISAFLAFYDSIDSNDKTKMLKKCERMSTVWKKNFPLRKTDSVCAKLKALRSHLVFPFDDFSSRSTRLELSLKIVNLSIYSNKTTSTSCASYLNSIFRAFSHCFYFVWFPSRAGAFNLCLSRRVDCQAARGAEGNKDDDEREKTIKSEQIEPRKWANFCFAQYFYDFMSLTYKKNCNFDLCALCGALCGRGERNLKSFDL